MNFTIFLQFFKFFAYILALYFCFNEFVLYLYPISDFNFKFQSEIHFSISLQSPIFMLTDVCMLGHYHFLKRPQDNGLVLDIQRGSSRQVSRNPSAISSFGYLLGGRLDISWIFIGYPSRLNDKPKDMFNIQLGSITMCVPGDA